MKRGRKSFGDLTVVSISDERIEAPVSLTPEQKSEWDAIVTSLPANYFRPGDVPLLAAFCIASVFHKRAATDIETRGVTLMDDRGREFINPSHQLLTSQASVMAQLAVKLRLCPSARMSGKASQAKTGETAQAKRPWGA